VEAFLSDITGGWLNPSELTALGIVIWVNVILSGDNAIVVGMAAAGLPAAQRRKCIVWGITAAAVLRILLSVIAVKMLSIVGLLLAGGLLLLWVCWKFWQELRGGEDDEEGPKHHAKTFRQAVMQILIADLSMSLDNVLAVAGVARDHLWVMVFGLALSVVLMAVAADLVARLLQRFRWIAYGGLAFLVYISLSMVYEGGEDVLHALKVI